MNSFKETVTLENDRKKGGEEEEEGVEKCPACRDAVHVLHRREVTWQQIGSSCQKRSSVIIGGRSVLGLSILGGYISKRR